MKEASWYGGKPFQRRSGRERIVFVTGGFWAISKEATDRLDWPDPRIKHNGGDVMLGEALHQQDIQIKQVIIPGVHISDADRRGYSEIHPGITA